MKRSCVYVEQEEDNSQCGSCIISFVPRKFTGPIHFLHTTYHQIQRTNKLDIKPGLFVTSIGHKIPIKASNCRFLPSPYS